MDKQEKIQEGIENLLATFTGEGDFTSELLDYLHSQGVVIKVDDPNMTPVAWRVAVEPLIKEDTDGGN